MDTMKSKVNFVLVLALGVVLLGVTAAAQDRAPGPDRKQAAVYLPRQSTALLQPADWDDHHRCDGDHDRDDRHCYLRGRDGDRYYFHGNGYLESAPYYAPGWYDSRGRCHRHGWYDRKGRWHPGRPPRDGDDR